MDNLVVSSHVMQYGNMTLEKDVLFSYMGTNPANDNYKPTATAHPMNSPMSSKVVSQRDASLLHLWHKVWGLNPFEQIPRLDNIHTYVH